MGRDRPRLRTADSDIEVVVTDDGSRTLRFASKPVTWHSESGAISESQLVYLQNSGVAERLSRGLDTRVFELGFGVGLNFWLTASLALEHQTRLEYVTVEPNPIDLGTLQLLEYDQIPACQPAYQKFAKSVFRPLRSENELSLIEGSVTLNIHFRKFESWVWTPNQAYDAVFFDPFDPAEAPDLWEPNVFAELFRRTKIGGKLVTYCVKSSVQKILASSGFVVSKTAGPKGGKREVLVAHKPARLS